MAFAAPVSAGAQSLTSWIDHEHNLPYTRGYNVMCLQHPDLCRRGGAAVVHLTPERLDVLARVNRKVNHDIAYRPDATSSAAIEDYRHDGKVTIPLTNPWSVEPRVGDCEDYAVTKLSRLLKAGWPRNALRFAIAVTAAGVPHAMLTVETAEHGTLVLDNRTDRVLTVAQETDLTWLGIERLTKPGAPNLFLVLRRPAIALQ